MYLHTAKRHHAAQDGHADGGSWFVQGLELTALPGGAARHFACDAALLKPGVPVHMPRTDHGLVEYTVSNVDWKQ